MTLLGVVNKLRQYIITASRMTPRQIAWRTRRLILHRWWRVRKHSLPSCRTDEILGAGLPVFGRTPQTESLQPVIERAEAICQGRLSFLNQTLTFDGGLPDWSASPDGDPLWTFNLHYFDYAYSLLWAYRATGQPRYLSCLIRLVNDWIESNPFWTPIAWNVYPLSKRLIAWTTLLGHLRDDATFQEGCLDRLVSSLCQQARFLAHNLEYDVDNNHLITNARALIWAGVYLAGHPQAHRWYDKGRALLERQANRQVLADGGHWERSSSYHLAVLQDFLETTLLKQQADKDASDGVVRAISKMYDFLLGIVRPDGSLPLLNDSVVGYPVPVCDILAVGAVLLNRPDLKAIIKERPGEYLDWLLGEKGRRAFEAIPCQKAGLKSLGLPQTGYYVLSSNHNHHSHYLVFDCGPIGPRHSPAHAHADTLSLELWAYNQAMIIDPGVYEYQTGKWRDYFRSTAAHNTVTVDGQDQSVFWGSFRVAEMARAELVQWETNDEYDYVEGRHNGYTRFKNPVIHQRSIRYLKPNQWIVIDTLQSHGGSAHRYDLWFHLTPAECSLDVRTNICRALFPSGVSLSIHPEHPVGTKAGIQEGWISYSWKQKVSAPVVRYHLVSSEPRVIFKTTLITSLVRE